MNRNVKFLNFLESIASNQRHQLTKALKYGFMTCMESEFVLNDRHSINDPFIGGYIEAAFFTADESDDMSEMGYSNIAAESLSKIERDCMKFKSAASDLLSAARDEYNYTDEQAGRDFWFTRNGHGVGFWDRGLGDIGESLTKMAKVFPEVNILLGDNSKVYIE